MEWGVGVLYHALRLRRGSSVSPRDSQKGSGETSLQWHLMSSLVSTPGSDLPLSLCPWGCLAFLSASKFCPSYLLIKWLGVTGVEGAIKWQGKNKKKQGYTGGRGQILGNLQCHADEFGHDPEDELNWVVVTRSELCLEKTTEVGGCGKWIQGGSKRAGELTPKGLLWRSRQGEMETPTRQQHWEGKGKTAVPCLQWVNLRGFGWVWSIGGEGDI